MNRSLRNMSALCVTLLVCTLVMQASPLIIQNGTFNPTNPPFTLKKPALVTSIYFGGSPAVPWVFSDTDGSNRSGIEGYQYGGSGIIPRNGASFNALLEGQSYISQPLSLTGYYTLTFYLTARTYSTPTVNHEYAVDPVAVLVGGTMQTAIVKGVATPTGVVTGGMQLSPTITLDKGTGWTKETVTFTATSGELLTFEGINPSSAPNLYTGLDDVSARVPEPAMALLLPLGLLFVNGLRKRFLA